MLPGQRRELEKVLKNARAFDGFRTRTRRTFLGVAAVGVLTSAAAFFVGRAQSGSMGAARERPPTDEWLNELATGPLPTLEAQALHLLGALQGCGSDDPLWHGFYRLVLVAAQKPQAEALRRMLRNVGSRARVPVAAREAAEFLR